MNTLFYVHDPMCSWCWGFKPTLAALESALQGKVIIKRILGGLAPDTSEAMPEAMQSMLQQTWQRIAEAIPGTEFNFDFWTNNTPRRATYPACRAVIAAAEQGEQFELDMIDAIQHAYYLEAKNPSNDNILIELAQRIGCNQEQFVEALNSENTQKRFQEHLSLSAQLGVQGFPSLVLVKDEQYAYRIPTDYVNASTMLSSIENALAE